MEALCVKRSPLQRVLAVLCAAAVLLAALVVPVYAETAAERYNRLKKELEQTRASIESYKNDLSKAKQLRAALQEEKLIIDEMVLVNQQEIERTQGNLVAKQEQVAQKRQSIYENDQLLQQRLIAIYNMNNASVLGQLLSVDSFSEILVAVDAMQRISRHDTDLLAFLSAERAKLEEEEAAIDQMLAALNDYHAELLALQENLAQNIMDVDGKISYTQAQIKAQQQIEGDQNEALLAAQAEMARITSSIGGSKKGDGSQFVGGRFVWPFAGGGGTITCEFGQPDPNGRPHRGMDIANPGGTPILAVGNGKVIQVSWADASFGHYLIIDHGDGVKTLYAHCSAIHAAVGQEVTAGTHVADVGTTGFSTGNHLHLEVHNGGALDNPRSWLTG